MAEIKKTSSKGIQFLIQEEGLVKRPYLDDAGIPTIGIGCTYYESGAKVKMTDPPISEERAIQLFQNLLKNYELGVYSVTRDDINQNQFDALTSLTYNIGVFGFRGSTLLKKVNANPSDPSIKEAFEQWRNATINGSKKPVLLGRRKREAALYFAQVSNQETERETYINHVKHIQKQLNKWASKLPIDVDGSFGKATRALVMTFQSAKGLDQDGIVGRDTLAELNKI